MAPTRSDRLTAVLLKSGAATQAEIDSGQWAEGQCPYVIRTGPDGSKQVDIDKGEALLRGKGATLEAAIAALEAKVGITPATPAV